jgi:hypothetical protein
LKENIKMEDGRDLDELTELSDELRGTLKEKKKKKPRKPKRRKKVSE